MKDPSKLTECFDFDELDENHELFSNMIDKATSKLKIESPQKLWTFSAKSSSFVCSTGQGNRTNLRGIQKKARGEVQIKDYYIRSMAKGQSGKYVQSFILRNEAQEIHLKTVNNLALHLFDDKRK